MRTFCAVFVSAMLGSAGCAPMGGDDAPPVRDGGHEPGTDGPPPDGPTPDGPDGCMGGLIDCTPPTLVATSPADGATGVAPMPVITVRFDEAITAREPANGLLLLDEAGQPVPGMGEIIGDLLRFVPADDLALLGAYTAVVTTTITDLAGNPLAREHRFQLAVRDGTWDTVGTPLESGPASLSNFEAAMDPRGNTTVVWLQHDGMGTGIRASHYDARAGRWETVHLTEPTLTGQPAAPRVAMDGEGNAIAVWQQSDGARSHVRASRHDGTAWGEPVRLDASDTADAHAPRIAMNDDGAAIVMWQHAEDGAMQAWIRRYAVGIGWGVAEPVYIAGEPASIVSGDATTPQVSIDARGDAAVLVLDQMYQLQVVPHRVASGWGAAETVLQGPVDDAAFALGATGHAFAIWRSRVPPGMRACRRAPGGASQVEPLMLLEASDSDLRTGTVAANAAGDGIALWFQTWPGLREVWASVYSAEAQAWSVPQGLLPPLATGPRRAQAVMDPRGHAHAAWIVSDGDDYQALMTARRVAPGGFGATILFEGIENASLAGNAQGKAVLIRVVQTADRQGIGLDALRFR